MDSFDGPKNGAGPEDPATLAALTPRLRALDNSPAPDAAFVRRLEEVLMRDYRATPGYSTGAAVGLTTTTNGRAPVIASRQTTRTASRRGRWWSGARFAAGVALLLIVAGLAASRWAVAPKDAERPRGVAIPALDSATPSAAMAGPEATPEARRIALLLIVDRSGSMSYDPLGRTTKVGMAQEALRLAAGALADGDQVGIVAFNDQQEWLVEMTTLNGAATREGVDAAIDRLTAEGGTELLPALALGLDAVRAVDADARHVVFFSDGKSRTGTRDEYRSLIDDATADGVTISTIAIGDDADVDLLRFIADEGGGRYRDAATIDGLPGFALDEARVAMGSMAGVPDPAECRVAPRPTSGIPGSAGTPVAARQVPLHPTDDPPAAAETIADISVAWREVWACVEASAPARAAALFSNDGLRRTVVTDPDWAAFLGSISDPDALRNQVGRFPYNLIEAWMLPDGRVGAVFTPDPLLDGTGNGSSGVQYGVAFVRVGDRWLIDEMQEAVG